MIHAPEVPEDWRVCQNQAGQNIYCIADLSKRGVLHTSPLYTILATIKSCHCLILWFRKTSAVAAAHIAATDDARANGGQTDGWRADGGIETEPHRTRPASRGEAEVLLSSYGWGFSVLKLPLYFHVSTCIAVLSECPSFLDASWQSLVNSAISLIQKKIRERWKKSCREVLINSTSNVAVFGIKPASNFPDQRCPALSFFSSSNSTFE